VARDFGASDDRHNVFDHKMQSTVRRSYVLMSASGALARDICGMCPEDPFQSRQCDLLRRFPGHVMFDHRWKLR